MNTLHNSNKRKPAPPQHKSEIVGNCPICGNDVHAGNNRYFCINNVNKYDLESSELKNACNFMVYKNCLSRLGKEEIASHEMCILLGKESIELEGLKRRDGTTFNSHVYLGCHPVHGWQIQFGKVTHPAESKRQENKQDQVHKKKRKIVIRRSTRED